MRPPGREGQHRRSRSAVGALSVQLLLVASMTAVVVDRFDDDNESSMRIEAVAIEPDSSLAEATGSIRPIDRRPLGRLDDYRPSTTVPLGELEVTGDPPAVVGDGPGTSPPVSTAQMTGSTAAASATPATTPPTGPASTTPASTTPVSSTPAPVPSSQVGSAEADRAVESVRESTEIPRTARGETVAATTGDPRAGLDDPVTTTTAPALPPTTATTVLAATTATTPAPSSDLPTTAVPTTALPTTAPPTTVPPTTALPTTAVPTTALPTTTTTTVPPTTALPTTAVPTTALPTTTTTAPVTTTTPASSSTTAAGTGVNAGLEALRNVDQRFNRYHAVPSSALDLEDLTEPASVPDNGSVGDGQFRVACQYSHFAYDDPIVYPGQSGRSHLHMFFGNTGADAFSTTESLVNSGGGTCNGFELNRSGYWTPALLDGRGNAVVPEQIILYYKTKQPDRVQRMPQGLKMVAGNTSNESFSVSDYLAWSCGDSGRSYNRTNRIPDCGGDTVNAAIVFPQCWDGHNLDSPDHRSHMATVSPHADCPPSHPVRLPQISILLYFEGVPSVAGWRLSSDGSGGFNTGPGATLHADWWGGWNDEAMDLWIDGCMKAARNCSYGQTGTDRMLAKLNAFQNYPGPKFLPLP